MFAIPRFVLRWLGLSAVLFGGGTATAQTILRVDGTNGSVGGNGAAWGASAFKHLQDALAQAYSIVGDGGTAQVWVRQGTYKPDRSNNNPGGTGNTGAAFALASGVAIYGGFAGTETLLSQRNVAFNITILSGDLLGNDSAFGNRADNSMHVLTASGVSATAVLDGIRIYGGNADSAGGGGLLITSGSPAITGCTFTSNFASLPGSDGGGAARIVSGSPVFSSCTFDSDRADNSAGGGGAVCSAAASTVTMTGCTFTSCAAAFGSHSGALRLNGAATISGCTFTQCGTGTASGTAGGGSISTGAGTVVLRNCQFTQSNTGGFGGAVNAGASTVIVGCTFTECQSTDLSSGGGAVYGAVHIVNSRFANNYANGPGSAVLGALSLTNCIFDTNSTQNQPGLCAVSLTDANATVTNCTFFNNYAPAALRYSGAGTLSVRNSIFWENRAGADRSQSVQVSAASGTLVIDRCCVQNWTGSLGGIGNFGGLVTHNPRFVDTKPEEFFYPNDLRLFPGSPCIDAGSNAFLPADILDADNDGNTAETIAVDQTGAPRRVDDGITADTGDGSAPLVDLGAREFAADYCVWTNTAGGAWTTGANWYQGPPTGKSAVFDTMATYTVTFSGAAACGPLTVSRGEVTLALGTNTLTTSGHGTTALAIGPWTGLPARLTVSSTGAGALVADQIGISPDGVLSGAGTIDADLVSNRGVLDPGGVAPGALILTGDYEPFFESVRYSAGNIAMDVEGESAGQYDTLSVQGQMTVAGGLIVRTPEGFEPSPTLNLPLITFASKFGGRFFDVAYLPGLRDGRFYKIDYLESGSVNLVVLDLGGDVGFGAQNNTVNHQITAAASGELNNDGLVDVAVATADGFVILLFNGGNDTGGNWLGFTSSLQLSSGGADPAGLVIADFDPANANGNDVAVTNSGSDNVVVLYRNGGGVWNQTATVTLAPGAAPRGIAAADFDGNGSTDLAAANYGNNTFSMMSNSSGSGVSFGAPSNTSTGDDPTTIDPWDPDNPKTGASLVVGNSGSGTVSFHPNNGDGTFAFATTYSVGDGVSTVRTEDVNNDGLEDIVSVNTADNSVSFLICSGGSAFYDAVNLPVGGSPRSLILADVDNDGDLDAAVTAEDQASQRVVQLLQNATQPGDYTVAFVEPIDLATAKPPALLTHGDVNQDGFDDIIALSDDGTEAPDNITVRLNLFRTCTADFDRNQFVNGDDFDAFTLAFEAGDPAADVNHDTFVTGDDFDLFMERFEAGC